MKKNIARRVYDSAFAAGRVGDARSDAFNAGVLACLDGRLNGKVPLVCPHQPGTAEHNDFFAGVAEGRELSPAWGLPFGETDGVDHD